MFPPRVGRRLGTACWPLAGVLSLLLMTSCNDDGLFSGPTLGAQGSDTPVIPEDPCPPPDFEIPVRINEVMLINETVLMDEDGKFPPAWLELHNFGDEPVDVSGAFLGDSLIEQERWEIPCIEEAVIPAGGFLIIYLDGDMENDDDLHASFIPPTTGEVTFVFNVGTDIVEVDADVLEPDMSSGRFPDALGEFDQLLFPTPGAANSEYLFPPEAEFIRGDVNEDGLVEVADADLLLQIVFSEDLYPNCQDRLDTNDDGIIDITDASFLYMALEPGGPTIPPPFPEPGMDLTVDDLPCLE